MRDLPDARDGLTAKERVVLVALRAAQAELRGRSVPMPMLYGRVVERMDMSRAEFERIVHRLMGRRTGV